jgi:hypothetical protein
MLHYTLISSLAFLFKCTIDKNDYNIKQHCKIFNCDNHHTILQKCMSLPPTQLVTNNTDYLLYAMATCLDPHLGHLQANILYKINYNCMLNYKLIVQDLNPYITYNTCCLLILQF